MKKATGTFEVSIKPLSTHESPTEAPPVVAVLEKRFTGDLDALGKGQMLTAITPVQGSAGYVAIEQVTGSLHGRQGSFILQHSGTLDRGQQQLSITVVPDSGTGELVEIAGRLNINIVQGQHFYDFIYSLPM